MQPLREDHRGCCSAGGVTLCPFVCQTCEMIIVLCRRRGAFAVSTPEAGYPWSGA